VCINVYWTLNAAIKIVNQVICFLDRPLIILETMKPESVYKVMRQKLLVENRTLFNLIFLLDKPATKGLFCINFNIQSPSSYFIFKIFDEKGMIHLNLCL